MSLSPKCLDISNFQIPELHVFHGDVFPSYNLPTPSTTKAVYPYIPPSILDGTTNQNEHIKSSTNESDCSSNQHANQSNVVDMDVMPRMYTFTESHYSENPMSSINPEAPPAEVYQVSKVVQGWAGASNNSSKAEPSNQSGASNNSSKAEPSDQSGASNNSSKAEPSNQSGHEKTHDSSLPVHVDSNVNNNSQAEDTQVRYQGKISV